MTNLINLIAVSALPTLAATPALAHGGHASLAAHSTLHLLIALSGVFGAGAMGYLAVRAAKARGSAAYLRTDEILLPTK